MMVNIRSAERQGEQLIKRLFLLKDRQYQKQFTTSIYCNLQYYPLQLALN